MKKSKLIILLGIIFQLTILSLTGQNIINSPEIIMKNNIASLETINCLSNDFCIYEYYEFDDNGQITAIHPGIIALHFKYEYDSSRLIRSYVMNNTTKPDSINSRSDYFYSKENSFEYSVNYLYDYRNNSIISQDTNYDFRLPYIHNPENPIRNSKGQIIEHDYDTIYYPCGIIFEGMHKLIYDYNEKGLINTADIKNSNGEIIVSLEYKYKRK